MTLVNLDKCKTLAQALTVVDAHLHIAEARAILIANSHAVKNGATEDIRQQIIDMQMERNASVRAQCLASIRDMYSIKAVESAS